MDKQSSDRDNPAKRRCLNDRNSDHSDSLFVSQSPEPITAKEHPAIEDALDDNGSDSDDESESDSPTYDESREPLPARLAFDPRVENNHAKAASAVKTVAGKLGPYASMNKDLENMFVKTAEVMMSRPRTIIVGMTGGTGAGKSALINGLIGCLDLAKELSGGEACTSVPMLYVHKLPGQTSSFAAKVSYHSVKECRRVLKWLLDSYDRYTFHFDKAWTKEEEKEFRQEANTALDTLRTIFCNRKGFKTRQSAIKTLARSNNQGQHSNLLSTMAGWYGELLHRNDQEDGVSFTFCESNTVRGLRAILDPLITPKYGYSVPSLWPLVKEVSVGVPSSRILLYLTLVDLPGLSDTNKIRVRAAHEHLRKCEALWYVVPVDRVLTDPDLDYAVSNYSDRFRGKLAVVVTKVDKDVTDALAEEMISKGQPLGNFHKHKDAIANHNAHLYSVCDDLKKNKKSLTPTQKNNLRDRKEALETEIEKLASKKTSCVVRARNSHVKNGLVRDKAQYLPEGTFLPVVCVSNRHYAAHKGSTAPIEGPLMDVKSTCIPALRSYGISLADQAVWDNSKETLIHKLKVLFHGVHGWAQSSPMERDKALADVVKPVKSLWEGINKDSADRCIQDFSSNIADKLLAGHGSSHGDMMRQFDHFRDAWNPLTFLAFFRNDGNHSTRAVKDRCWNEDFLRWQKTKVFTPAWDASPNPVNFFDDGVEKLIKALEDIPVQLNSKPESVPLCIASFTHKLQGHIGTIRSERDRIKRESHVEYGNIKLLACLDQPSGYFTKAMKPCYYAGRYDNGEGVCERVKDLLHNHLTQHDPLKQANGKLKAALEAATSKQAGSLCTAVMKILNDIDEEFERMWKKDSETAKEAEARFKIGEVLRELMPEIERIETDLLAIEREYQ